MKVDNQILDVVEHAIDDSWTLEEFLNQAQFHWDNILIQNDVMADKGKNNG